MFEKYRAQAHRTRLKPALDIQRAWLVTIKGNNYQPMKRKTFSRFLLAGLVFCCAAPSQAQLLSTTPVPPSKQQQTASAPVDETLGMKETIFDFGKIPQGKPVTHIFDVVNNGKDSLKIENVQASCGCTTPEWERNKTQAPGEKTNITVGYNAASEGPFTKFITITYNGTQSKQITIKGEVWKTPVNSAPENKAAAELKE
jgi:hypothetical protein